MNMNLDYIPHDQKESLLAVFEHVREKARILGVSISDRELISAFEKVCHGFRYLSVRYLRWEEAISSPKDIDVGLRDCNPYKIVIDGLFGVESMMLPDAQMIENGYLLKGQGPASPVRRVMNLSWREIVERLRENRFVVTRQESVA